MEVHQYLKSQGFLTQWQDVPSDSEIIFVSHEWLSWAHPDPKGEQLRVMCHVLERLKMGVLSTEMDPMHTILYKHKYTTKGKDWKAILKRTYLWVDWFSMPQPGAEKEDKIGNDRMAVLRAEGSRAIRSIPAYVERSDFIMILVPGCHHTDRKVPTCYRTWRRRGWCLLELYAAAMSRDSSNPPLLVRSERGTPKWMSPLETLKLSIGLADFTCCQRNHVITTETQKIMNKESVKKIPCDKPIAGGILEQLINVKINHLFNAEKDFVMARIHCVFKHWWMRGLKLEDKLTAYKNESAVEKFKKELRWKDDEKWFDCGGVGVLIYAVTSDEPNVVRELLQELEQNFKGVEYTRRLESRIRDEGYVALGVPGGTTTLMAAMMTASPEIVSMLLEYGTNFQSVDVMGNDAFMFASSMGRPKNLQCWLQRVKDWDLNRQNTVLGGCALGHAVYMGANKLETVKVLLNAGARLDYRTFNGGTVLTGAVANEDSDPNIVQIVLEKLKSSFSSENFKSLVNYQKESTTIKWKSIHFIGKTLYRTGMSTTGLMEYLALASGKTPLNFAVARGDVEIVKLLLKNGADPYTGNDLGMNAFEICEKCGPFPSVHNAMLKNVSGEIFSNST
jgi:ankyrin repeat protein